MATDKSTPDYSRLSAELGALAKLVENAPIAKPISGGAVVALLPLVAAIAPQLIQFAMQIYSTMSSAGETSEEKRLHYARIAASLDAAGALAMSAPLPPVGSGA